MEQEKALNELRKAQVGVSALAAGVEGLGFAALKSARITVDALQAKISAMN